MTAPLKPMQDKLVSVVEVFFLLLLHLIAAILMRVAVRYASHGLAVVIKRIGTARQRPDLEALRESPARGVVLGLPLLCAAATVFPGVRPGGIFAALGLCLVAIGFAFKGTQQRAGWPSSKPPPTSRFAREVSCQSLPANAPAP